MEKPYQSKEEQLDRQTRWSGQPHGSNRKLSYAERQRNKYHTADLTSIAKREAISQKRIFKCPFCEHTTEDENFLPGHITVYHHDDLLYIFEMFKGTTIGSTQTNQGDPK